MRNAAWLALACLALTCLTPVYGADVPLPGLRWRLIGPYRAGRVTSVAGVAGEPNTYYFGTPGGGIWKTGNAGQTWKPIFDSVRVASIGAVTVAPSDARVVWAGTGEQTVGDGVYRSMDAGATWRSAGLRDIRYIQAIVVDPKNPNVAVVGANSIGFGDSLAADSEGGVYGQTGYLQNGRRRQELEQGSDAGRDAGCGGPVRRSGRSARVVRSAVPAAQGVGRWGGGGYVRDLAVVGWGLDVEGAGRQAGCRRRTGEGWGLRWLRELGGGGCTP